MRRAGLQAVPHLFLVIDWKIKNPLKKEKLFLYNAWLARPLSSPSSTVAVMVHYCNEGAKGQVLEVRGFASTDCAVGTFVNICKQFVLANSCGFVCEIEHL